MSKAVMSKAEKGLMDTAASTLSSMAEELASTAREAGRLGTAATRFAGQTVRENPLRSIGVLAGIALLLGIGMMRRR